MLTTPLDYRITAIVAVTMLIVGLDWIGLDWISLDWRGFANGAAQATSQTISTAISPSEASP
eukprot:scaffold4168_cov212-Pinguiococcus_pyrenoidosus.AAC.2